MVEFCRRIVVGDRLTVLDAVAFQLPGQHVDVVVHSPDLIGAWTDGQFLRVADAGGEQLFVRTIQRKGPDLFALRGVDGFIRGIRLVAHVRIDAALVNQKRTPHVTAACTGGELVWPQHLDFFIGLAIAVVVPRLGDRVQLGKPEPAVVPLHPLQDGVGLLAFNKRGQCLAIAVTIGVFARHDFSFLGHADEQGVSRTGREEAGGFDGVNGDRERITFAHPDTGWNLG